MNIVFIDPFASALYDPTGGLWRRGLARAQDAFDIGIEFPPRQERVLPGRCTVGTRDSILDRMVRSAAC